MTYFSVIIASRNLTPSLRNTLESLNAQTLSPEYFDVYISDNRPKKTGKNLLPVFIQQKKHWKFALKIIKEPVPGAGRARNKAAKYARGRYLAFLDDDAKAEKSWLAKAKEIFEKNPEIIAAGGPIFPLFVPSKPDWFHDEYETFSLGNNPRFISRHESFTESNLFIERDLFLKLGGFDESVGMTATFLSSGEERRLFARLDKEYPKFRSYYSPHLLVYHYIPGYKTKISYRLRRSFAYGQSWRRQQQNKSTLIRFMNIFLYGGMLIISCFIAIGSFPFYSRSQNWLTEQGSKVIFYLGYLSAGLEFSVYVRQKELT